MRTPERAIALVAAAVIVLGGCSSSEDPATDATPTSGEADVSSTAPGASATVPPATDDALTAAAPAGEVRVHDSSVGPILVDGRSKALYVFLEDTAGQAPTCVDAACTEKWPPVLAGELEADGVDAALFGTVARPDGTEQVTVAGLPVYTMGLDLADGEPSCQGGEDVWWAISPDGTANRTLP